MLGGGYIGVELGHFYAGLGTDVEFLVRSRMVGLEDKEVITEFERVFAKKHKVRFGVSTKKVSYKNKVFSVTIEDKYNKTKTIKADALLVATGIKTK